MCQEYAAKNGGECLSKEYKNNRQDMIWKCGCGHIWETRFSYIKNTNSWCPKCSLQRQKNTMLERYGVTNPSLVPDFALKIARKTNAPSIKHHWSTDEELVCQGGYEPKVVDYLNANHINYQWQQTTFTLSDGKTYRPDFYLVDSDTWVEIKGYFRDDAKKKWDEFQQTHSNSELWDKKKLLELGIDLRPVKKQKCVT